MSSTADPRRAVETIFRIESAKLIAGLARMTRDVGLAEELAQDALVLALEKWPESGVPDNPGAWLMTTAKNRALNEIVRKKRIREKHEEIGRGVEEEERRDPAPALVEALDDEVGDDLLRLVFTACHPVLSSEARLALTRHRTELYFTTETRSSRNGSDRTARAPGLAP